MAVTTRKVAGRRKLHFQSLDEVLADAERLVAGEHRTLGNWSLGQILDHLATMMNGSIDGFAFRVPWPVRQVLRLALKRRLLTRPMRPGFRLPRRAAAELERPPISAAVGLENLRRAIARQKQETKRAPSPALGRLSRDEWNQLHLRHAELHLSFVAPE